MDLNFEVEQQGWCPDEDDTIYRYGTVYVPPIQVVR